MEEEKWKAVVFQAREAEHGERQGDENITHSWRTAHVCEWDAGCGR